MTLRSLLPLLLFLMSCSALEKAGLKSADEVAESPNAGDAPKEMPSKRADALPSELLSSQDVSRGRKLPSRYERFQAALGALDERVLLEEAEKFLAANEHDIVILNGLGIFHLQKGRPEAARIFWEKAREAHKDHPTLLNNIAVIELQNDRQISGLDNLRTAYKVQPRHFEVLVNLGTIYLQGGQFQKAKDFLQQAAKMRSTPALNRQLAVSYHLTGEFKKAKSLYEELLKEDMRNVTLMFNYANLLVEHLNDPVEAKVWLNRISFLGSDDQDLLRRVQRLSEKTM